MKLSLRGACPERSRKGFTLIELLVVMFIIGILATLVIVNVSSARKTARDTKRMADLKSLKTALEQYYLKNGSYPSTGNMTIDKCQGYLCDDVDGNNLRDNTGAMWCGNTGFYAGCGYEGTSWCTDTSIDDNWILGLTPNFLSVLPDDPKPVKCTLFNNNLPGEYIYKSDGNDYKLRASGTMETIQDCNNTAPALANESCNSNAIQEMADPCGTSATYDDYVNNSISVYSAGASVIGVKWCLPL